MRGSEKKLQTGHTATSEFVADGYERAIAAIESEVRSEVEQKYADEWNASGLLKRWFMLRTIDREIADGVTERSEQISPNSMF